MTWCPEPRAWADLATAQAVLAADADEYVEELLELVAMGAQQLLVIGVPDIGIQPISTAVPKKPRGGPSPPNIARCSTA
jgi:hypothetical protein